MIVALYFFSFLTNSVFSDVTEDVNLNDLLRLTKDVLQYRPSDVKPKDVSFYLFTRNDSWNEQIYSEEESYDLDTNKSTKIIIHGWIENHNRSWYKNLTNEYLKKGDFNIIQVDWGRVARSMYISSAQNTQLVGKYISNFILKQGFLHENIHLIGHSLGAHVAAFAAREVKKKTGKKIARITGLDPAGPYFRNIIESKSKLSVNDAEIVDVIHTDGGFYGYLGPLGTFDIYVNGGIRTQPGCEVNLKVAPFAEIFEDTYCSHKKSYVNFINIINNEKFKCHKCNSWISYLSGFCNYNEEYVFGAEDINKSMTGVCFVKTS